MIIYACFDWSYFSKRRRGQHRASHFSFFLWISKFWATTRLSLIDSLQAWDFLSIDFTRAAIHTGICLGEDLHDWYFLRGATALVGIRGFWRLLFYDAINITRVKSHCITALGTASAFHRHTITAAPHACPTIRRRGHAYASSLEISFHKSFRFSNAFVEI